MMNIYGESDNSLDQTVCKILRLWELKYVPVPIIDNNTAVVIGRNVFSATSLIITRLIRLVLENNMGYSVTIVDVESNIEMYTRMQYNEIDIVSELFEPYHISQQLYNAPAGNGIVNEDLVPIMYESQWGIYVYRGNSKKFTNAEISHWYFMNNIVDLVQPLGTNLGDPTRCSLWWCKMGQFIPSICTQTGLNCAEILVYSRFDSGYDSFTLASLIESLKIPLSIVFVNETVIEKFLLTETPFAVFTHENSIFSRQFM